MKLERLHESVLPTVALGGGLILALLCGSLAGTGKTGSVVALLGGIAAVAFFLIIRQRVWMLIPAVWMLGGKISVLPLPFTVAQLGVLFAFGTFLLLKAFKRITLKPTFGIVETWMFAVLLYLVTVFLRNPVGVEALGSNRIGGRPYFDVIVAFAAFWVLARVVATPRDAFILPLLSFAGYAFDAFINAIAYRFPSTVGPLSNLYSGIAAAENPDAAPALPGEGSAREGYWRGVGSSAFNLACCFWRPFTLINPLYFGRFLIFLFACYAILISGFRSALFSMAEVFLLSTYFRRGFPEVFRAILIGVVGLSLLIALQGTLIELPLAAQRTLSFLPGNWDYVAKSEAESSTQWRVDMWKAMLTEDKYIANKWLGDGFGFTAAQLQIMLANSQTGSNADQQENLLISGGVHSGPLSTIRYVGYVGLALFLIFLVLLARRGSRLVRRAEGTPFYPLALLIGIAAVLHPFNFVFIFGAFDGDLPNAILNVGMQRMLENSLDAYEAGQKKKTVPAIIQPPKFRRPPQFAPLG